MIEPVNSTHPWPDGRAGISARVAGGLAWGLWAVFAVTFTALIWLEVRHDVLNGAPLEDIGLTFAFWSFATVGAVIASRRPRNSMGWIFLGIGLLAAVGEFGHVYSTYAYAIDPSPLPGRALAAWVSSWFWYPLLMLFGVFTPLLFPDGRPPSRRWWPLAWVLAGVTVSVTLMAALADPMDVPFEVDNPIGVYGTDDPESEGLFLVAGILLLVSLPLVALSVVSRYRRAQQKERQQLKWFMYATVLLIVAGALSDFVPQGPIDRVVSFMFTAGLVALPISVGIAVLQYRLYDVDRIINKSIVYGALSALLIGGYALLVLVLQALLPLSGRSPIAVATSTLAMAALFGPMRSRVQAAVDKRFYRARYNAILTVEAFGERLRREPDLDALTKELVAVVDETVQPRHVSVWLRGREAQP